jgi:hypothetical protein
MFTLYFGVLQRVALLQQRAEIADGLANHLEDRRSPLDWLSSKARGLPTNGELAARARRQARSELASLQPLIDPARALDYMLSGLTVF